MYKYVCGLCLSLFFVLGEEDDADFLFFLFKWNFIMLFVTEINMSQNITPFVETVFYLLKMYYMVHEIERTNERKKKASKKIVFIFELFLKLQFSISMVTV